MSNSPSIFFVEGLPVILMARGPPAWEWACLHTVALAIFSCLKRTDVSVVGPLATESITNST